MKGLLFNIQRYSLHDGQGIRTLVFFKGCPLHCPWCCNPESQSFEVEEGKIEPRCIHCTLCSKSEEECPSGAIVKFGKYMTSEEVMKEVTKDSIFYTTSGGGMTLSGGEVLSQASFAIDLLRKAKDLGIHTAIETCGVGSKEELKEMVPYLDLILFDLKIIDDTRAKVILGVGIEQIIENLKMLVELKKKVVPRIPLIPGFTMEKENINKIIELTKSLGLKEVHLLPFHQYGSNKYTYINKKYTLKDLKSPSKEEIEVIKLQMEEHGLLVSKI